MQEILPYGKIKKINKNYEKMCGIKMFCIFAIR